MQARTALTLAAVAATAATALIARPAGAAPTSTAPARPSLIAVATSWPSATVGAALAYPSRAPGATPSLFSTTDAGKDWHRLPTPPVPFPEDNDTPDLLSSNGVLAISNGTQVTASLDAGQHWSTVTVPKGDDVGRMVATDGVLYALLTRIGGTGNETETLAETPIGGAAFQPVPGISVSGGEVYGDVTAAGGNLQVVLGHDFTASSYWDAPVGYGLRPAPAPCGADVTLLGGASRPQPVALCTGSPSDIGIGQDDKHLNVDSHLGGVWTPSGVELDGPNQEAFAAATTRDVTVATAAGLEVTFDGGRTWSERLNQPEGAFWMDLGYQTATTGVAVADSVDDSGNLTGTIERTTDSGQTWTALPLP